MLRGNGRQGCGCFGGYRSRSLCAVSFGLGMCVSCFCPGSLTLFLAAVIMVALGVSLMRH